MTLSSDCVHVHLDSNDYRNVTKKEKNHKIIFLNGAKIQILWDHFPNIRYLSVFVGKVNYSSVSSAAARASVVPWRFSS